jgi:hypothetical protein
MSALKIREEIATGHNRYKHLRSSEAEEENSGESGDEVDMERERQEAMEMSMSEDEVADDGSEE